LLDFENKFLGLQGPKTVASRAEKQSLEQKRRDVYDSHRHRTFALAYYMTGNEMEAEGILVRTFTRVFSGPSEPNGESVDSSLLQELRDAGVLKEFEFTPAPDCSASLGSGNIRRTELEEAVQSLPSNERLVFLLRDVEGYQSAPIARLLGRTEPEINRTLLHARIRIRQRLAEIRRIRQQAA
jgi:RNA polymerase sigma-70 factor (ECF subfamily)